MIRSKKVLVVGSFGLLAIVCLFREPKVAHAVAAALVQVSNTAASPAVTQDVSKLSAQANQFWCPYSFVGCFFYPGTASAYTVPTGKTLMITAVDFVWEGSGAPTGNLYTLYCGTSPILANDVGEWYLAGGASPTHYSYPTGFPAPSGCEIHVVSSVQSNYDVIVRGYVTAN